jgi:hypothetical protein
MDLRCLQLVMGFLAEFGVQISSEMLALEVVRECNTGFAYFSQLAATFREDLVLVLRVPGQKLFGLGKVGFGCHGAWISKNLVCP